METSPLICSVNQWTSFYMITASVLKGLKLTKPILLNILLFFVFLKNSLLLLKENDKEAYS